MPQTTKLCAANQWTLLTDTDATRALAQFQGGGNLTCIFSATVGNVAPTTDDGLLVVGFGAIDRELADFHGVSGANRLWAMPSQQSNVFISYA